MTRTTAIRLLLLQTALMILLAWAAIYLGRDEFRLFRGRDDEQVATASHVESAGAMPVVQLSDAAQKQVGIAYAPVHGAAFAPQSGLSTLSISSIPSGVYVAEVRDGTARQRIRVVIAR